MPKQNLYLLENFVVAASNFGANRRFPRSPLNNRSRLRHILQSAYRTHLIEDPPRVDRQHASLAVQQYLYLP